MTDTTQTTQEEVLPKHSNGSTERMVRLDIEPTFAGYRYASAQLAAWTVSQEIETTVSRAAGVHISNGIAAGKAEMSGYRGIERSKSHNTQLAIASVTGGQAKTLVRALEPPKEPQKS